MVRDFLKIVRPGHKIMMYTLCSDNDFELVMAPTPAAAALVG